MRLKPENKYQSVSLAVPFIEEIKRHIKGDPRYSSVADYVRYCIRVQMKVQQGRIVSGDPLEEVLKKLADNQEKIIDLLEEKRP